MTDQPTFTIDDAAPTPRRDSRQLLREALTALPNLVKLLVRLLRDPRISRRRKLLVGAAAVYLVSPIDLVPELLVPVIGRIDDLVLVVFSIHYLLKGADADVITESWDGSEDALELVAAFIEWGAEFMPAPMRRMLTR